ncbi:MAG: hypothetical protein ACKPGT_16370, partial [Microcystis sp.]
MRSGGRQGAVGGRKNRICNLDSKQLTATENQTLTASNNLADADGIETLNYQWQQSTDGTNW